MSEIFTCHFYSNVRPRPKRNFPPMIPVSKPVPSPKYGVLSPPRCVIVKLFSNIFLINETRDKHVQFKGTFLYRKHYLNH